MELDYKQKVKAVAVLMLIGLSIAGYYAFILTKMTVVEPPPEGSADGGA